jgi:hypothetical protein
MIEFKRGDKCIIKWRKPEVIPPRHKAITGEEVTLMSGPFCYGDASMAYWVVRSESQKIFDLMGSREFSIYQFNLWHGFQPKPYDPTQQGDKEEDI